MKPSFAGNGMIRNDKNEKKMMNNIVGRGLSWLPLLGKDEGQEGLR